MLIILKRHNRPIAILNTSYTVAKGTAATKLAGGIAVLEETTRQHHHDDG